MWRFSEMQCLTKNKTNHPISTNIQLYDICNCSAVGIFSQKDVFTNIYVSVLVGQLFWELEGFSFELEYPTSFVTIVTAIDLPTVVAIM